MCAISGNNNFWTKGTKVSWNENSTYRTFAPGSESTWEQKYQLPFNRHSAMLNYAGEAGKAGDGNTAAFTAGGAAKMTRAVS